MTSYSFSTLCMTMYALAHALPAFCDAFPISLEFENTTPTAAQSTQWKGALETAGGKIREAFPSFFSALKTRLIITPEWTLSSAFFIASKEPQSRVVPIIVARTDLIRDQARTERVLLHELIHRLHFEFRKNESDWVREGLALEYERRLTGFSSAFIRETAKKTSISLTDSLGAHDREIVSRSETAARYGLIALFFEYSTRNCLSPEALEKWLTGISNRAGLERLDEILKTIPDPPPACASSRALFTHFQRARYRPDFTRTDGYATTQPLKPIISTSALSRSELRPFSAHAYHKSANEKCLEGDEALNAKTCLQLKFD